MRFLLVFLILAVCANTVVHFFFTPYREYEANFQSLRAFVVQSNQGLREEVNNIIFPRITNIITGINRSYERKIDLLQYDFSTSSTSVLQVANASIDSVGISDVVNPFSGSARIFQANGEYMIHDGVWRYRVGDNTTSGRIDKIFANGFVVGGRPFIIFSPFFD